AYRICADILRAGNSAVADSCNTLQLTRRQWEQIAWEAQSRYVNIEIVCSDLQEHRQRVETRLATVPGLKLPDWGDVEKREYHDWTAPRLVIDTAHKQTDQCINELLTQIDTQAN